MKKIVEQCRRISVDGHLLYCLKWDSMYGLKQILEQYSIKTRAKKYYPRRKMHVQVRIHTSRLGS